MVQSWVERESVLGEGRTEALAGVMAAVMFEEWYKHHTHPHRDMEGSGFEFRKCTARKCRLENRGRPVRKGSGRGGRGWGQRGPLLPAWGKPAAL